MNQCVLVGRLQGNIITENSNHYIKLAVTRPFKNVDGIYENDIIKCSLNDMSSNFKDMIEDNSVLGIKGRIQVVDNVQTIVADKVTFLNGKSKNN